MKTARLPLTGRGHYPLSQCLACRPERDRDLILEGDEVIARGSGTSYGDASLNTERHVVLMNRLDRFLSFDPKTGIVHAEAGITLEEITSTFIPRGWCPTVLPLVSQATLGGCVAGDVHGLNHRWTGSFGQQVRQLELLIADGRRIVTSTESNPELFWATVGGLGLTGIITSVAFQLMPVASAYVCVNQRATPDLCVSLELLANASLNNPYAVAWIDCLASGKEFGRGVVTSAHHANESDLPLGTDSHLSLQRKERGSSLLLFGRLSPSWMAKIANKGYYALKAKKESFSLLPFDGFFFPSPPRFLFSKKKRRIRYQCALPSSQSEQGLKAIFKELQASNHPPSHALVQPLGGEGQGLLSFALEGYALDLEIPLVQLEMLNVLDRLDDLVTSLGGRVALLNDCRLRKDAFRSMYPRFSQWSTIKTKIDPQTRFSSDLSRRLIPNVIQNDTFGRVA